MTNQTDFEPTASPMPMSASLPLPLNKPFFTYILLGIIVVVFIAMTLAGGSTNNQVLIRFGSNVGVLIMQGETWRLFTSMFIHIGLMHLLFNAYALFIFGLEMERLYGPDRYITIYILSGLFGSLASFAWRGPMTFSAGASGAIFGIIGMNLAFFLLHRETFGNFGRQRMMNTVVIIAINLVFGFTAPGIDNLAHMGGLVAGFLMGYGLAPRYQVSAQYTTNAHVVDTVSLLNRWWVPTLAIVLLAGGVSLAITYWSSAAF
jgi:rhomboid protease GluP